jgi:hypothetical protein
MNKEQAAHAMQIASAAHDRILIKYAKGQAAHGGCLWDKTALELVDEALAETVDQFTYLLTLRDKMVGEGPGNG